MKKYHLKHVDAFTTRPFTVNPAAVVLNAQCLTEDQMQAIAREMNLSETAFILPSEKADLKIRWFSPTKEVLFCGHATVASLHALAEEKMLGMDQDGNFTFQVETLVDILELEVCKDLDSTEIVLQAPKVSLIEEKWDREQLAEILRILPEEIDAELPLMRDETVDYILIPITSLDVLKNIDYDYDGLSKLSEKRGVKGFALMTMDTFEAESDFHSRFFTPFYGVVEDPVTGSSQGPMAVYLIINDLVPMEDNQAILKSEQGDIMGRKGRIQLEVQRKHHGDYIVKLRSRAVTVLDGHLILK